MISFIFLEKLHIGKGLFIIYLVLYFFEMNQILVHLKKLEANSKVHG